MTVAVSLLRTLGFSGLYVAATYAGRLTVMDDTNLSLVWPAAGVSAVWFLAQRTSRWLWVDVLALSAVTMAVNTATGAPAQLAGFFVVANLTQALVFVCLFRRWLPHLWGGGGDQPIARLRELWRLIAIAVLSTAAGALIGPTGVWLVNGAYSWPATAVWMTRNTVSILLIGVTGIRIGEVLYRQFTTDRSDRTAGLRHAWSVTPVPRRCEYLAVVTLSAAGYYAVFGINHGLPLAFAVLVMTVWTGLRLNTAFVILHDITFGSTAILFTLHGTGVFVAIDSHATRALVVQLFVGMIAVVGLALALGRDERATLICDLTAERRAAADQATLMSGIVDAMAEGLTVTDEQGRILLRNPAVRDLMGGVVSTSGRLAAPGYYGLFHPDGSPLTDDEVPHRRALAGEDVHGMDVVVRNPGVPDGRILNVSAVALPGDVNGTRCAVTVFHDVTADRRHRDELASFAGVVAHDLLNPLAAIDGWATVLAEACDDVPDDPLASTTADGVTRIRRSSARMHNLINGLLAYTTARDATIAATDVNLTDIVTDIAAARIDQARSQRALVPQFHVDELHTVHADPVLVRQLLDNLISNAIKYTALQVTPRIQIRSETVDGLISVTVIDNGIGIPAGQHHSIFDNFHRVHTDAGYTGTGLGLGICQRIVQRHGGTITATANPAGHGSAFIFTLPANSATAALRSSNAIPTPTAPARRSDDDVADPTLNPDTSHPVDDQQESEPVPVSASSSGFHHTARIVLDYLHDQMPLSFWAITRVENGRQTYLYLDADNGYGLRQGGSHPWEDSYCIHMAAGRAPAVALDAQKVPAYAHAGVNTSVNIGAYVGAAITEPDGTLFGAICGLDPQTRTTDPRMAAAEPTLALLGHLLTTALAADRARNQITHALLTEQVSAETDALTGLPNRRAWQRLLDEARTRYERLADPTVVAMLDLDNLKTVNDIQGHAAGDAYIVAAGAAVRRAIRETDTIARLGGDEFGLLLPNCTETDAEIVAARIHTELETAGVAGSLGWASITVQQGFTAALANADTAMYAAKQQRRQRR